MIAIKGTTVVETFEIDLVHQKRQSFTKTDNTRAVMAGEIVVVFWIDSVIELTWVKVPIPTVLLAHLQGQEDGKGRRYTFSHP